MPLTQSAVSMIADRMPKRINPKTHAIIDYALAATFLSAGAFFWRRHRRAAIGSLVCGATMTAASLLTDYPGGAFSTLTYRDHRKFDVAVAAVASAFPSATFFRQDPEAKFFVAAGLAATLITSLTDFSEPTGSRYERWDKRRSA